VSNLNSDAQLTFASEAPLDPAAVVHGPGNVLADPFVEHRLPLHEADVEPAQLLPGKIDRKVSLTKAISQNDLRLGQDQTGTVEGIYSKFRRTIRWEAT
jgi:hypothetical protein